MARLIRPSRLRGCSVIDEEIVRHDRERVLAGPAVAERDNVAGAIGADELESIRRSDAPRLS